MKKTVLTFGLISGAIISVLMLATLPFAAPNRIRPGADYRLYQYGAVLFISVLRHQVLPRKRRSRTD